MVGGQHRSDEVTRAERVGWKRNRDRRRKKVRLAKGRAHAIALVCPIRKSKDSNRKEKMKNPLDYGRRR
jgi:hypothetical protein